tara:strand:- start:132 stop:1529 length:1398 start_codon:yes stop_codon:yes gene_type:complete
MLFNSFDFIVFLPIVLLLFFAFQQKFRVAVLLVASYYFYMSWNPIYILLIVASTITDYSAGRALSKTSKQQSRNLILAISIIVNLGLLFFFKYTDFLLENINATVEIATNKEAPFTLLELIIPVGISFYTFQTISYTIDVYNRKVEAEKNLSQFALYVSFFPQLVAGPIERYSALAPQFKSVFKLTKTNLSNGFRLMLYGLFMKMVVADNIGIVVDETYNNIGDTNSLNLMLSAVLYSFQIYCDFHGYSTIAIGVARLFDVQLSANFKAPYLAHSLTTFWRKWHITLTTWFRDYIYYPLGGNRVSKAKWFVAVTLVFIVSGIWHGAQWTFIIWGALHGIITVLEKLLSLDRKSNNNVINLLKGMITFVMVTLLWVFFRSPDLESAAAFFEGILVNTNNAFVLPDVETWILVGLFFVFDAVTRKSDFAQWINNKSLVLRWSVYFVLAFLILSRSGTDVQPFIYFQF